MIFVNIAAYRDPECMPTIRDMFQKARWPEQVAAGVVLQTMPSDGLEVEHERVRVLRVNAAEARGPCWARALGYRLWQGERYVLQIDSHMRFAPDWDARLLDQLAACPSPKPLLTTYPPGYEPPDELLSLTPTFLAAKEFDSRGLVVQQGLMEPRPTTPKPTAFLAAGFLFGPSAWIKEAPYDPHLYFHGEEPTLALRLWTHGWDFFGPTEAIIWHQYGKTQRPLHWEDDPQWDRFDSVSLSRVRRVLQLPAKLEDVPVDLTGYGLGRTRTARQYRRMSGVNYTTQTLARHAVDGDFPLAQPAIRNLTFEPEVAFSLGGIKLTSGMFALTGVKIAAA